MSLLLLFNGGGGPFPDPSPPEVGFFHHPHHGVASKPSTSDVVRDAGHSSIAPGGGSGVARDAGHSGIGRRPKGSGVL